jgi:hypothetical protein
MIWAKFLKIQKLKKKWTVPGPVRVEVGLWLSTFLPKRELRR